ncbi:MAG TPA: tetratricopeptide repeat protein, partial [Pilimelia sp.]|nr:tetratricopeptide repeat protein [Pilimelia sp.]
LAVAAGDDARCAGLLREHGAELLAGGHAPAVVSGVRALPARFRDQHSDLVLADALQITGDTAGAISVYSGLAGDRAELPAALAWRYGAAVYLWGDPQDALGVLRRGPVAEPATTGPATAPGPATAGPAGGAADRPTADEALLLAWTAAAYWLAGDTDACAAHAHRAQGAAVAAGDDRALAAAHVALGLHAHLAGDPAGVQGHYTAALELAESAGDVPQVVRIRANLAAGLEQQGRFAEALEAIAPAVALAEQAGYASMLAMALSNEGVFLHRLGRLDEAVVRQQRSAEIYQRTHSHKVAYPLVALGDVHRRRGRLSEAKAAYDEAIRASESDGGNRQGLVPALAGLARVLAASDPAAAGQAADRAVTVAAGHQRTTALLARGWSALGAGERAAALRDAAAAMDSAGRHRDRAGLAEALELRAAAGGGPQARAALAEARAIWRDAGAGLDADRVQLALAELPDADQQDRLRGRLAAARLAAAGIVAPAAAPDPAEPLPVQVKVLGGLAVLVGGRPVPATAWQSRKARDLLRALVARRGQPVARDELADLLWGPVDPTERDKVNHRLSVALSTLRAVLDPERRAAADYFVIADSGTIAADLDHITLDVLQWLAEARYGLRLRDSGDPAGAWAVLTAVEREYTGEAFADDPYDGWSRQLSEEARATCLHVLRVLVELSQRSGDTDDAVRYLLRLLAIDPYDEQSHWDLVGTLSEAGRHGEARRAHQRYAEAMAEIGVPVRDIARRSA